MVEIVTNANRSLYRHSLEEMHRFRYHVAVGQWGWKIPGIEAGYDKDAFDTDDTIYFLAYANLGDHLVGCARLNPTNKPHMLSEVFRDLCDLAPIPSDPSIYEFSRYIIDHKALSREDQMKVRGYLSASINRFCVQVGITDLTWFAYQQMYARALKVWDTKPLGVPKYFADDDATYIAAISKMSLDGLARIRAAHQLDDAEPHLGVRQPWDAIDPTLFVKV